jgi:iron complex transport system ATP-binding protein
MSGGTQGPGHSFPPGKASTRQGSVFQVRGVDHLYPGEKVPALSGLDLAFPRGEITGILGPNGSGKSTLLKVLLGSLTPTRGLVEWEGRALSAVPRAEMARRVGVVPQAEELAFPVTVRDFVAMGRYPHLGPWRSEGEADRVAIRKALVRCGVDRFADRGMDTLSGGEMQRARIARALAQEPDTLVLDEPTAALDIRHEMGIFDLLSTLARREGVTVILVTHHLNLAARYCSGLVLLACGRCMKYGRPEEVIQKELLETVYGWPLTVTTHPGPGPDRGAPQVVPLSTSTGLHPADPR